MKFCYQPWNKFTKDYSCNYRQCSYFKRFFDMASIGRITHAFTEQQEDNGLHCSLYGDGHIKIASKLAALPIFTAVGLGKLVP